MRLVGVPWRSVAHKITFFKLIAVQVIDLIETADWELAANTNMGGDVMRLALFRVCKMYKNISRII